jgi:hypothetical protein
VTLNKLSLRPDQAGYAISMPTGVLMAQLDGGAPRTRRDVIGAWIPVQVQWSGDAQVLSYIQQALRYCEVNGGAHFLIDLIIDSGLISEREAMFVPGTLKLGGVEGNNNVLTAQLMVAPDLLADNTWPVDVDFQDGLLAAEDGELLGT